ncbi:unknown [Bacillus sp. CAG:988]|nr:unknown [Bacillus sp. CAG:988]
MKKSILVCLIIGLGLLVFGIVFLFVFPAKSSSSDSVDNSNLGDDSSAELETSPTPTSSISSNANIQLQASITKDVSFDEFQLSDYFYYQVGYLTKQNTIYIAIYNSGTIVILIGSKLLFLVREMVKTIYRVLILLLFNWILAIILY